jgi:carbonic anhydrase
MSMRSTIDKLRTATGAALLALLTAMLPHQATADRTLPDDPEEFVEVYEECVQPLFDGSAELPSDSTGVELDIRYRPTPLYPQYNDNTLRVFVTAPSYMTWNSVAYRLVVLDLHLPGATLSGNGQYPLLVHFVHTGRDNSLGVLGVRVEEGDDNDALAGLLEALGTGEVSAGGLDPKGMLPSVVSVDRYLGPESIETCDFELHWYLADQPVQASSEQLTALRALLGATPATTDQAAAH